MARAPYVGPSSITEAQYLACLRTFARAQQRAEAARENARSRMSERSWMAARRASLNLAAAAENAYLPDEARQAKNDAAIAWRTAKRMRAAKKALRAGRGYP
jgi:Na+-translocating ferredoxin:NAD+ oxidoreductase RnfC subunit